MVNDINRLLINLDYHQLQSKSLVIGGGVANQLPMHLVGNRFPTGCKFSWCGWCQCVAHNHTVGFFKVEMGGVNVKLLEEGFSELDVKSGNDSLQNGSKILIFWRFNKKKITMMVIIYKIFAPLLEVWLLCGSVTRFWKNGRPEIVDNVIKVLRGVWYFGEFNHG